MSYSPKNPNGQETMANSEPVVIASDQSAVPVSAASLPLPSGAATSAKQDTGNTSLATIAGAVAGTEMQVDVLTMPTVTVTATNLDVQSGGADIATSTQAGAIQTAVELIDDTVATDGSATPTKGILIAGQDGTNAQTIKTDTNGELQIDVLSIAAGNNNIGDVDVASIAAGDNNIGNVDVVTLPATPAGTNAIGKLLPPDIDVTTHTNYAKKYYTNAGAVTDGIIWSPAAGKRWHVVALHIQVSAAATVTLEDDKAGGDEVIFKAEYAANGGEFLVFPEKYPLASGEDAADLLITTSAGNVYVTAVGYEI